MQQKNFCLNYHYSGFEIHFNNLMLMANELGVKPELPQKTVAVYYQDFNKTINNCFIKQKVFNCHKTI